MNMGWSRRGTCLTNRNSFTGEVSPTFYEVLVERGVSNTETFHLVHKLTSLCLIYEDPSGPLSISRISGCTFQKGQAITNVLTVKAQQSLMQSKGL